MADWYFYQIKPKEQEDGELGDELDACLCEDRNLKVMGAIPGMLGPSCLHLQLLFGPLKTTGTKLFWEQAAVGVGG